MINTWYVNTMKLNVGKKVQPILGSRTKSRKKSHIPSDDSSQTPTPKPIISEVCQKAITSKALMIPNMVQIYLETCFGHMVSLVCTSQL